MTKVCPKCKTKNLDEAKFCEKCGKDLPELSNTSKSVKKDKNADKMGDKKGNSGLSNGQFLFLMIGAIFLIVIIGGYVYNSMTITKLSMNTANAQIDDKTTEYVINGTAEPNAVVNITSSNLNLTNAQAQVDSTGKFEYKLQIPLEVTNLNVAVDAQAPNKKNTVNSFIIDRPVTSLSIDPVSNLNEKTTEVTITGKTEPNSLIFLSSSELKIDRLNMTADSSGNFKYTFKVPLNITSASISISAQATGRKPISNSITINRISTPQTSTTTPTDTQSTSYAEDFQLGYNGGQMWANKAISEGGEWGKYDYLPSMGGTYPAVMNDKSADEKSGYEAGYIDYLKSVGEYP